MKAKNYSRFCTDKNEMIEEFFNFFEENGVDFKNKTMLEIGCGTGVWSFHLAKYVKELDVIDASCEMLAILKKDQENLGITNVASKLISFNDFKKEKEYDFVFLALCPVLNEPKDFEHFLNLSPKRIYINFASKRQSSFLDPIFEHFKISPKDFGKDDLEWYLDKLGLGYLKKTIDEERLIFRNYDQALQTAKWHLSINDADFNIEELESLIPKDGVNERLKTKVKCLIL